MHCYLASVTFVHGNSAYVVLVWRSFLLCYISGVGCGTWKEGVPPDQTVYSLLFQALKNVIERYVTAMLS